MSHTPRGADGSINLRSYGAKNDGSADIGAALQGAFDAMDATVSPNALRKLIVPGGNYLLSTAVATATQRVEVEGQGHSGTTRDTAAGVTRIRVANGITGLTWNPGASPAHAVKAFMMRNIHLHGDTGATAGSGLVVQNMEQTRLQWCTFSDFPGGTALTIDGGTGSAQYAELWGVNCCTSLIGLHLQGTGPNGIDLIGGYFEGLASGFTPAAGSIAIHADTGDTFRSIGTKVQGWETGIQISTSEPGHEIIAPRIESCLTGIKLIGTVGATIIGGNWNTSLLAAHSVPGPYIGISIDASCVDTTIIHPSFQGYSAANKVVDNGTNTMIVSNDPDLRPATPVTLADVITGLRKIGLFS